MGSLENQSFGNGFLHPTETNGKVITCKGTCKYTRNLQFYASLSLVSSSISVIENKGIVYICSRCGMGTWASIGGRRDMCGTPSRNGGPNKNTLYFYMSHGP